MHLSWIALLLLCTGLCGSANADPAASPAAVAATAALQRLAPDASQHIRFALQLPAADGLDAFTIAPSGDRIVISGTNAVAMLSGFRWYLENVAHGQISREGVNYPKSYPLPSRIVRRTTPYRYRYAYNFTVFGYTAPYWRWPQWQHELDLLALHGVNMALMTVGQEAVWYDTFRDYGYSDAQIRNWIVPPAHQPWEWMSNMHSYGGAVSTDTIERRAQLGRRILERMQELGIEPVLPGFSGSVPDGFARHATGAHIVPQGDWCGFQRPDWLASNTPLYAKVAADFYKHQTDRFGLVHAKAIDLLHEGGRSGGVDLTAASEGVRNALAASDRDYLWVMQGWLENPRRAIVEGTDPKHLLIIDLQGMHWNERAAFWGAPWLRGFLTNMGGRVNLYGDIADIARLSDLRHDSATRKLEGSAQMDESFDRNPVVTELSSDLTWATGHLSVDAWLPGFVAARYGRADPDAVQAWRGLAASAYSQWDKVGWGGPDSLFNAQPSLDVETASYGNQRVDYDSARLEAAWRLLLRAGARLNGVDTYRYDIVDITQQVIANRTRPLLVHIAAAYRVGDRRAFGQYVRAWFALMDADDAMLRTRREFMLGPWLADARAYGVTPAEKKQFEWDARSLITVWGPRSSASIADYANRSWSGLVSSYYRARWKAYFDSLDVSLETGKQPVPIDWWAFGDAWDRRTERFPTVPAGDSLRAARAVERLLSA
jgi:hypothetical protein